MNSAPTASASLGGESRPLSTTRGPSLLVAIALVIGTLSAAACLVGLVGGRTSEAIAATALAWAVATASSIAALIISWRTLGGVNALAGTLASGGVRVGVPLVVMLIATQSDLFSDWFRTAESRFAERLGGLYLLGLAIETGCVYLKASQFNVVRAVSHATAENPS